MAKHGAPSCKEEIVLISSSHTIRSSSLALRSITPSDQKPPKEKGAAYGYARYVTFLATKSSFLRKDKDRVTEESKALNRMLLQAEQEVPEDSLFCDDLFEDICEEIMDRNEAKVIQDITQFIAPSA